MPRILWKLVTRAHLPYHWPNAISMDSQTSKRTNMLWSQELQVQMQCMHCPGDILGHHAEKTISFGGVGD